MYLQSYPLNRIKILDDLIYI